MAKRKTRAELLRELLEPLRDAAGELWPLEHFENNALSDREVSEEEEADIVVRVDRLRAGDRAALEGFRFHDEDNGR